MSHHTRQQLTRAFDAMLMDATLKKRIQAANELLASANLVAAEGVCSEELIAAIRSFTKSVPLGDVKGSADLLSEVFRAAMR